MLKIIKIQHVDENANKARLGGFYGHKSPNVYYIHPDFYYLKNLTSFHLIPTKDKNVYCYDSTFQKIYVSLFDATANLLPSDTIEIFLDSNIRELLQEFSTLTILNGVNQRYVDSIIESNFFKINFNRPYFIKSNQTSGKNTTKLKPVQSLNDFIIKLLTTVEWNNQYEYDDNMSILCIPWKDIDDRLEFRLFVYKKNIITICVQKWFNIYTYTDDFKQDLQKALTCFQADFVDTFEHENYSADIYFQDAKIIELIEVNPWGNSGPGLFTYDELDVLSCENRGEITWKTLTP
jgi:hypothetical protein